LSQRLTQVRKENIIQGLRPDGKSQVSVEYEDDVPKRVDTVVIAAQHDECDILNLRKEILNKVIKPVLGDYFDDNTRVFINKTGVFILGGPAGDTGVTGRKIIVDTYGGMGRHGGGAFSGKDPSKVDRSAAYAARYVAKNIVAARLADKCEVQVSYVIGYAEPLNIFVECFGTNKIPHEKIEELVRKNFSLKPAEIINELGLKNPIYRKTCSYGHFGKEDLPWENTSKAATLKAQAGI
jgi:S-adenosylmethionine synthetase